MIFAAAIAFVLGSASLYSQAQDSENEEAGVGQAPAVIDTSDTGKATDVPESDEVMRELLLKRKKPPVITPSRRPDVEPNKEALPVMPAATVNIDPTVLGVAPGDELPPLLVDGTMVVNRTGRLKRTPEGFQIFVFEADDSEKPERPLIMQPCKKLESMEKIVQELGDRVIFTVSGQVQLYRNNNYLLPTMVKLDYERDNLSN
ncbi:hypothetical protein [Poriferisphaera corsica]|nr:hypothetical protein [Poriferisphaera corsica]